VKLYSDVITRQDIFAHLPEDVSANVHAVNARKTKYGYVIHLEYLGENTGKGSGRRRVNSGEHGAGYHYAATWDEHGIWMAALYELDPDMEISYYNNRADFMEQTGRYQPKGSKAPWLKREENYA
jgi:hypothetical protein